MRNLKDGLIFFLILCRTIVPQTEFQSKPRFLSSVQPEVVVFLKVMVPSAQLAFASKLFDPMIELCVEALEGRRYNAENKWLFYQKQIRKTHNKKVSPKSYVLET